MVLKAFIGFIGFRQLSILVRFGFVIVELPKAKSQ